MIVNSPLTIYPSNNCHTVGDSAFQRSIYVIVSFRDTGKLSDRQKRFNRILSQTRYIIENAFGYLKGRFRRLKYVDADVHKIPNIFKAACILHDISLHNPEEEGKLLSEWIKFESEDHQVTVEINLPDIGVVEKSNFIASLQ